MNKAAQVLLGTAIAVVFPALAVYAAITLLPNPAFAESAPSYPNATYPEQPNCTTDVDGGPTVATKTAASAIINSCREQQQEYQHQLSAQQSAQNKYYADEKAYAARESAFEKHSQTIIIYRSILALAVAFAGITTLFLVQNISTLIYGLAAGAGLIFLGAISVQIWSELNNQKLAEIVLLVVFAMATAWLVFFERRFHPTNQAEPSEPALAVPTNTPSDKSQNEH